MPVLTFKAVHNGTTHTCPSWSRDSDERETPEFQAHLWRVVLHASNALIEGHPTSELVAEWHRLAFASVVPVPYYAGGIRCVDAGRPCLKVTPGVREGPGLPPVPGSPPETALADLDALFLSASVKIKRLELRWALLRPQDRLKELAKIIGTTVGRFVHIHPFVNGNGRSSRVLWRALLASYGLPPQVGVLKHPQSQLYDTSMAAAMKGRYGQTIKMVLDAMRQAPPPSLVNRSDP